MKSGNKDVELYIASFAKPVQKLLRQMQATIKMAAPDAKESLSYGIPTFKLKRNLVHYAAFKDHIGFYPGPSGITAFKIEIAKFESSKGAIRFPLNKPLPVSLVTKITKFRVKEELTSGKPKTESKRDRRVACDPERVASFDYSKLDPAFEALGTPAKRALISHKILKPKDLAKWRKKDVLSLHGIGPSSLPTLNRALSKAKLRFTS